MFTTHTVAVFSEFQVKPAMPNPFEMKKIMLRRPNEKESLPGQNNIRHTTTARAGCYRMIYLSVSIVALTFCATGAGSGA